MKERIIPFF